MTETTHRIKTPADLLALVPCVLGFHPHDSLVLVILGGDGRTSLHARIDLSDDLDLVEAGIDTLRRALVRHRGRRVLLVAYTDDPVLAEDTVALLEEALDEVDIDVVQAIRADGSRWFDLDCVEDCCPPEGRPYDIASHPITAQAVLEGRVTLDSREALAATLVGTDTADRAAVQAAADEAVRRFRNAARHPLGHDDPDGARNHLVAEGHWVRDRVRRHLATGEPLDAHDAGRMAVAMVNIPVRDVAWSEMRRDNADRHVELWRDLVRRTPRDLLAAPAALLGFAAWLTGDGALAWCAVDRCREAEPDYSLAGLLGSALLAGIPPSTWTPVPGEDLPLFAS